VIRGAGICSGTPDRARPSDRGFLIGLDRAEIPACRCVFWRANLAYRAPAPTVP
jgi:hypothetical protein